MTRFSSFRKRLKFGFISIYGHSSQRNYIRFVLHSETERKYIMYSKIFVFPNNKFSRAHIFSHSLFSLWYSFIRLKMRIKRSVPANLCVYMAFYRFICTQKCEMRHGYIRLRVCNRCLNCRKKSFRLGGLTFRIYILKWNDLIFVYHFGMVAVLR